MREAAQPEQRARSFPRWSKHQQPTCPKHHRRLRGTTERMPTWTAVASFQGKNAVRKVWRCPEQDCHYVLASDSQITLGACERMHKALGRYKEIE